MTTQDKNKCIAEMLGWVFLPDMPENVITKLPQEHWNIHYLKFDSDANWQFEALDFISGIDLSDLHYSWIANEKIYNNFSRFSYDIQNNACQIILNLELDPCKDIVKTVGKTTGEAIFEALYQFSQYLKTH